MSAYPGTEGLGIKDMRAIVKRAGLSSADCISKDDLRARCVQAQKRLTEAAALREQQKSKSSEWTTLFGDTLLFKDGARVIKRGPTADALGGHVTRKPVALYFSAHWCPPCRQFTPMLANWYTQGLSNKLEIVFVSADRDESSFNSYYNEQPWKALPFDNRAVKDALSQKYGVSGIPALVILDADGSLITKDGRAKITQDPTGAWLPAAYTTPGTGAHDAAHKAAGEQADKQAAAAGGGGGGGGAAGVEPLRSGTRTIAGYPCKIVVNKLSQAHPKLAIVILHGYGATNQDFVDLASLFGDDVALVLPQAPKGPGGMTEWWEIDVMSWVGAMQGNEAARAKLVRTEFGGMAACRTRLLSLVSQVRKLCGGLPASRVIAGGFSQGAMTAMDLALSMPASEGRLGGAIMLSGGPVVVDQWHAKLQQPHMKGLPVLQTHGLSDQTLPYPVSQWAKQMLEGATAHKFVQHTGGHELGGMEVVSALREFVEKAKK